MAALWDPGQRWVKRSPLDQPIELSGGYGREISSLMGTVAEPIGASSKATIALESML